MTLVQYDRLDPQIDISALSLDELGALARNEHDLALTTARIAISHAIRAGEALLMARELVPAGGWHSWLQDNWTPSINTANRYMRFARYREILELENPPSLKDAQRILVGQDNNQIDPVLVAKAQELRRDGLTYAQIGERLGMTYSAIRYWLSPSRQKQYRDAARARTLAAQRALRKEEREKSVRAVGGGIARSYAHIRKALQELEAAAVTLPPDARAAVRTAMASLYNSEDAVVAASRLSADRP